VSDRRDRRDPVPPWAAALGGSLLALLLACEPLSLPEPPPAGDGGTPCSRATSISADTVVLVARVCNPWCIHVPAGTAVAFVNQDPASYLMLSAGPPAFEIPLPASAAGSTPRLETPGTVVVTEAHWPAATVTIFVE
jgi:hypothetical protein